MKGSANILEEQCEQEEKIIRETELKELKAKYFVPQMSEVQLEALRSAMERAKKENKKENRRNSWKRYGVAAAAAVVLFVALPNTSASVSHAMSRIPVLGDFVDLVTFREYSFESDMTDAQVSVFEITTEETYLKEAAEEVNAEIQSITDTLIAEFEAYAEQELGYKELVISSEVIASTEKYFTLKLLCYEGEASGYERNYYYTVDLMNGRKLELKDLFVEEADYISRISDSIKAQMRAEMSQDENRIYWIDSEISDMDFQEITEETEFYLNQDGALVISFSEGEAAPSYMGIVEFAIPSEVLEDMKRE